LYYKIFFLKEKKKGKELLNLTACMVEFILLKKIQSVWFIMYDDHVSSPYICIDTSMNVNHFVEILAENGASNTKAQNHADSYVFNKVIRVSSLYMTYAVEMLS
jgi:hypothetical protein